jgi:hypothetical protein
VKKPEKKSAAPAKELPRATVKEPTEGGLEDEADASEEIGLTPKSKTRKAPVRRPPTKQ